MILVDTSALFALLDADDRHHSTASAYWMSAPDTTFVTHGYAVSETISLVRARLGWDAVSSLVADVLARVAVEMVDRVLHDAALRIYVVERGGTSFVDRVSIEFARRKGITRAFAFDPDLAAAGLDFPVTDGGCPP